MLAPGTGAESAWTEGLGPLRALGCSGTLRAPEALTWHLQGSRSGSALTEGPTPALRASLTLRCSRESRSQDFMDKTLGLLRGHPAFLAQLCCEGETALKTINRTQKSSK